MKFAKSGKNTLHTRQWDLVETIKKTEPPLKLFSSHILQSTNIEFKWGAESWTLHDRTEVLISYTIIT